MSGNANWRKAESSPGVRGTRTKAQPTASAVPQRKMEHIASVSRSSGLEKDGDALKNFEVQNEYREFIQGKLNNIWEKYPRHSTESETQTRQRLDAQENVLILFRKLREGIISSQRVDQFTLEVYETSLCLAVLFDSPRHISPVIPALMTYFHLPSTEPHSNCVETVLICLLHHLVAAYPSQREFHAFLASMPKAFLPDGSLARVWITSLAGYIRARNYAKIDKSTQISALPVAAVPKESKPDLSRQAIYHLVDFLRNKTREMAWEVMRSAYRELSCQVDPQLDTRAWLERSLGLLGSIPGQYNISLDEWLNRESGLGHVRRKDGVEGRWIVCKPR
ncbi:Pre-mrna-splicing factor cwc22 [Mycena venus]|uniref:Pre-mrna-splicing factor cwc22 n=1 Tax=Mycena venus TaxID=2733690 RepID=A0A8H6YW31_9AGAR|nr:Pre-mrna-splicing factor cwc22 [Mycena venus]